MTVACLPRLRTALINRCEVRSNASGSIPLAHAIESNTVPDREVSKWLREVPDKLYKKLVTCGLATAREKIVSQTVERLISDYVASRSGVAAATVARWTMVTNHLLAYFGKEKSLIEVTAGDADDFSEYLKSKETADNSRRRSLGIAKQFFTWAVRHKLIAENPFADQKTTVGASDPKRQFFVGPDLAERILETCPDLEWKLIFALMRFGGLRCPTEVLSLRWDDILWDKGRFRIYSQKTDETRYCPIFPELLPYLRESFGLAADGEEFVISKRHGMTHRGLTAQYKKILHFAGVSYPKPFQNLRSTRQTELERKHSRHVVCSWLGNSEKVALKYYLQVTEDDFAAGAGKVSHSPEKVSHKVPQHLQAPTGTEPPRNEESPSKAEAIPDGAERFRSVPVVKVGDAGIEPNRRSPLSGRTLEKSSLVGNQSAARGAANQAENALEAADLGLVVAAWPQLPDEVRKKIVHIVQSVQHDKA